MRSCQGAKAAERWRAPPRSACLDQTVRRGVNATSIDDILLATGTSKSQLYSHFGDRERLVRAVVRFRGDVVLDREHGRLQRLRTFSGLVRWRDALVEANKLNGGAFGCGLGSMAAELADQDEESRVALAETFARWQQLLSDGFVRMQKSNLLRDDADPETLATFLMAALQGGYLLADAAHSVAPMAVALDMALDQVRSYLVTTPAP
ncbi:TetR/AcrR family transcriptional regulator [Actinoplanes palleronii]|uniref:Transcriptional regulator, TetR family protein n=1 Tax=Actinoplanes palleronii TaxID=113570 RepID=A0ABQ4BIZ7_9ACTN|nr:TetR family transcriptional regulator C-terminal domain-containing protein [Actinoplanes palleronii]GIE70572.1 putative transcriptional regulator, TetR family protein [Actinoplanes palleronii]